MKKILLTIGLSLLLATNGYCAWNAAKPADNEKLKDTPALIRANWDAIALGTDANLLITNAKVSPTADIVDTKLHQITTASKVSTSAITGTLGIANGGTNLSSAGGTAYRVIGTTNGTTFGLMQIDLATAVITGAIPIANGGTGLTTAGGVANRVILTTDGSAWSVGQVGLTTMVTGALPVANGGTASTTASDARTALGLAIGTNVLAPNGDGSALTGIVASTTNVVFCWGGNGIEIEHHFNGTSYYTFLNFKFKKIAGVNSINIYALIKNEAADKITTINVDIGGANNTVTRTANTFAWATTSVINVSALTTGTLYDGIVQIKSNSTDSNDSAFCSAVTLIGS